VYDYEPIPKELSAEQHKYVLGAQGNVWTEYISTAEHLEYMVLPRMLALAETVWSPAATKNWNDFSRRLQLHFKAFDAKGLHYSPGNFTVDIKPAAKNGKLEVALFSEVHTAAILYTTDGSVPTVSSAVYTEPIAVESTQTIRAVTVQNGKIMNLQPVEQRFVMHKAVGANVQYAFAPSRSYMADGMNSLTNGVRGKSAVNKFWHGFNKNNLVATVDLGTEKNISRISLGCLQHYRDWIFLPTAVKFEVSLDGKTFTEVAMVQNDVPVNTLALTIKDFTAKFAATNARYVRVTAFTLEACPKGHPGEGKPAWTFADELEVE
jgi:hexosaminidase